MKAGLLSLLIRTLYVSVAPDNRREKSRRLPQYMDATQLLMHLMMGNAAKTLASHLIADVRGNAVTSWAYLESLIADRMTQWASAFQKLPSMQLIVGARLNNGSGVALYFCEPPNTIVRQSGGYVAIGAGASVTDPLNKTLFGSCPPTARIRLTQIAYLMHRAKEDNALCGGYTTAVVVKHDTGVEPLWVMMPSMERAEIAGKTLDFLLRLTADAIMQDDNTIESFSKHVAASIANLGRAFRELEFETSGEKIDNRVS